MADERTAEEKIADIPVEEAVIEEDVTAKSLSPKGDVIDENENNEEENEEEGELEADSNVDAENDEQAEEENKKEEEEKKPVKKPWQVKRVDKLYAEKKALEEELAELKKNREKKEEKDSYTKAELEEIAEQKANEKLKQQQYDDYLNRHNESVDNIAKKAGKLDADFNENLKGMIEMLGAAPMPLQEAIVDLEDDGPAVLAALVKDEDEAARFYKMRPTKVAIELAKFAAKLNAPKPKPKVVSAAPKPPPSVNTNGRTGAVLHDKMSDAEWMQLRNQQAKEYQSQRNSR